MGYEVHVFANKDPHYLDLYESNAVLHKIFMRRSYNSFIHDFLDIIFLAVNILIYRPKHIHSFNPKPQLLAFFSSLISPNLRYYIGVTGLGNTFIKAKYSRFFVKFFMSLSLKRASYVFFQNTYDMELFSNELSMPLSKAKLFKSPGVDLDKFSYVPYPSTTFSSKQKKFNILFVGRLLWQKGVDDFFSLYKLVESKQLLSTFSFTLVGGIDKEHPDRLLDKDIEYLESSNINWIKWTSAIERYYSECDVLVFMSDREGGPRAILESSAIGRPTIGCNAPGVNQLISEGHTGFLINKGDINTLFDKIMFYYKNPDIKILHGTNARKIIAEPLSLEKATLKQLEMYKLSP